MSIEWDSEADAGEVVQAYVGGTVSLRDPGGGPKPVHDLDVVTDRGLIAVEVTRHAVPTELQARAEVEKRTWRFPSLTFNWLVKMRVQRRVAQLHATLVDHLQVVEATGVQVFWPETDQDVVVPSATVDTLRALGVRYACRLTEADEGGGEIEIVGASYGGATTPDVVLDVVEHHAGLTDNCSKLADAQADERHLFIWVDSSKHQAVAAMGVGHLPERAPLLPAAVDVVWVAAALRPGRVWRYSQPGGWEDMGSRSPAETLP